MVLGNQTVFKLLKAVFGFGLLLAAVACAGLSPQGGGGPAGPPNLTLAPPTVINGAGGETTTTVTNDQPIRNEQPVPFIDPTCQFNKDKAPCLKDGVYYFNEEKRIYTPKVRNQLQTEIQGHVFLAQNHQSLSLSDPRFIFIKETVSDTCYLTKAGQKDGQALDDVGAVFFTMVTPPQGNPLTQVVPAFRYSLAKEGYEHSEGPVECAAVEGDFLVNGVLRILLDFLVWDECFAPLPPIGSPLNLGVAVNEPWVADYCSPDDPHQKTKKHLAPTHTTTTFDPLNFDSSVFQFSHLQQILNGTSNSSSNTSTNSNDDDSSKGN